MATIDSLDIQISASVDKANTAIRHLTKSVGTLATALKFDTASLDKLGKINGNNFKKLGDGLQSFANAAKSLQNVDSNNFKKLSDGLTKIASIDPSKLETLGKIDGNSFRGLGEGVKALSSGLQNLQGIRAGDFTTLANGIGKLAAVQPGNMEAVGNALIPLTQGINALNNAKFDNKNLQSLINSFTRLSNADTGSLANINFATLGNSIKGLADTLSGAKKVEQNTISMTNAIAKLANAGAGAGEVATALPQLEIKLKEFINTMSHISKVETETITFTQAIGTLANAGKKTETTANSLNKLGDELLKFFQTMSGAPNVSESTIRMTQALAQLANAGGRTGSAVRGLGNAFLGSNVSANTLNVSIRKLSKTINGLGNGLGKTLSKFKNFSRQILSAMGIVGGIYGTIRGVKKAMDISSDLTEVQNVVNVSFGDMTYKVEEFAQNSIEQFGMSELALKQYSSRFQSMGAAMGISSKAIGSANSFLKKQTNGYIEASDSMADMSLNLTKLTADMASFYNVEQKAVAEDLAAIFTGQTVPLRQYGLDLTQATLKEWALKQGLDADMKSMSQAEKTMLRYQYVMANTTASHMDFSRTADTWANSVRVLKQNFEQLASIIGGALINAFKPFVQMLNTVLKQVISFAKIVTEALGAIFGWKYEVSSGGMVSDWGSIEDSTGGVADNLGDAAKKVKEMNKSIRAWDELNLLTTSEPSKGSGGSGGAGGAGLGLDTDGSFGKLVPMDSILKDYESFIDNLYDLGSYISKALEDTLGKIEWDKIYKKAEGFGSGLSSFLNGLIRPGLFDELGNTVSGAINTALHFLDSFGEKFNWENFGSSLSSGLVSFLRGIQWETALSAASNWGKGIGTALNSFISESTFSEVGHAVAMALNTAIQFALDLGHTFDFKNLGNSIAAGINTFFYTFNFKGLAESINTWCNGLLDSIISFLKETHWSYIGEKIGEFISDIEFTEILGKVGKAIWEAINAALETYIGLFKTAPIETAIATGILGLKFTGLGEQLLSNLKSAILPIILDSGAWALAIPISIVLLDLALDHAYIDSQIAKFEEEQIKKYGDTFQNIYDKAAGANQQIKDFNDATRDQLAVKDDNILYLENLATKYFELKDKINPTAGEQNLLNQYTQELINKLPELNEYYDTENGKLDITAEKLKSIIAQKEKEIKLNAISESWTETLKQEAELQLQAKQNADRLAEAQDNLAYWTGLCNAEIEKSGINANLAPYQDEVSKAQQSVEQLTATLQKNKEGLEAISEQTDFYEQMYESISTSADKAKEESLGNGHDVVEEYATGISENSYLAADAIGMMINLASNQLEGINDIASENGKGFGKTFSDGISEGIDENKLEEVGENIVEGVEKPIKNAVVTTTIGTFFNNFITAFCEKFDIHSPSKVMEEMGGYIIQGLFNGIDEMADSVVQIFVDIKDDIAGTWDEAKQKTEEVWNTISSKVSGTWDNIKTWAGEKFNTAKESISTAWDSVKEKTNTTWSEVSTKVNTTWNDIKGWASDKFGNIKKSVTDAWGEVKSSTEKTWNDIKDAIKTPINAIIGFINKMTSGIATGINGLTGMLNKLKIDIPETPFTKATTIGFNIPPITVPEIQKLKTGGYVAAPMPSRYSLFAAGEDGIPEILGTVGGKTAVAGGEEITGIRDAVYSTAQEEISLLRQQNQLLQELLRKDMSISSEKVFKAVQKEARDYQDRTYRPAF